MSIQTSLIYFSHILFLNVYFFYFNSKIRPIEFNKIVSFVSALRSVFDESDLIVTATVLLPGHSNFNMYNLSGLSKSVDFINFVFNYQKTAGEYRFSDAIKSLEMSTDQDRIEKLITSGVAAEKIVLGVHLTGPAFATARSEKDNDAKYSQTFSYGPINKAQKYQPENWSKSVSPSGVSIVRKTDGLKRFAVVLENGQSVANKVRFAVKRGLAGIAPVYLSSDDVKGECGFDDDTFSDFKSDDGENLTIPERSDLTFPLLRTINIAIDVTLGEIRTNQ